MKGNSKGVFAVSETTIRKFEPRARLFDIRVIDNSDTNTIDIEVTFALSNTEQPIIVVTTISRAR